jgi:hypothetical protein
MSGSVGTSGLNFKDSTDSDVHNAALRNRAGGAADNSGDKKSNVNETAVETPFTSSNVHEAHPGDENDSVEYVKGAPVIKNGTQKHQSGFLSRCRS